MTVTVSQDLLFELINVMESHTWESINVFSGHATNTNTSTSMKFAIFATLSFPITNK